MLFSLFALFGKFWEVGRWALLTHCPLAWRDLCPYLWFLFAYIRVSDSKPSLSSLTLWVPWFACFCQPIMDLAATLTDFNGNAGIWLLANSLISFICFVCFFFIYPLLISLSLSVSFSCLLPFCVHSISLFFIFACFSLAWNGDWKPPKVWRNCKSQKQPAQQPCKSTRNFLWKRDMRENETRKLWLYLKAMCSTLVLLRWTHFLLLAVLTLPCPTDSHNSQLALSLE